LTIASSPIAFSGQWKPGGTAILTNGHATGRVTAAGHDEWGRWCYHTIIGQRNQHVTIISAYQVVAQRQALKGLYTTATQQQSLLIRQQDKITDPRTAFRRDLTVFLNQLRDKKHGIILLGDFNERLGDDPAGMSRIATEFNLIDLMRIQHPNLD
jgi:exonuclease III